MRRVSWGLLVHLAMLFALPFTVLGQQPAVADLQRQLNAQAEELAALREMISNKVDNGTSQNTVNLNGRVHADYWGFPNSDAAIATLEGDPDGPQDRIGFRRMRFGVKGDISPNMGYKIEMEFAMGNKSEFRDAYLSWNNLPVLNTLILGNQKRPYGLDHLNSSRYNVFLERPFVVEAFNQDCRRFGLVSYGLSDDQSTNWRYGVYNTELMQNDGQHINDHVQLEFAGRLAKTYLWEDDGRDYGHWAVSATTAAVDGGTNETRFRHRAEARSMSRWINTGKVADANNYELIGVEWARNYGKLQVVAEFENLWMTTDADITAHYYGGYVYAAYFLTDDYMPWSRKSGTLGRIKPSTEFIRNSDSNAEQGMGAWQIAVRWSWADFSESTTIATQPNPNEFGVMADALTVGLNWYWNANARMQFNWSNGDITNAAGGIGRYDIIGARFMVDF